MLDFFKRGRKRGGEESPTSDRRDAKRQASLASSVEDSDSTSDGYGIRILTQPAADRLPIVDIVFVHGLTGRREKTWTHKEGNTETFWPGDLLPSDITHARIMAFGYDADVVRFLRMTSQSRIANHANNLLSSLAGCRMGVDGDRPIIFIGHSLGGLVIKRALLASQQSAERHIQQILSNTYGIAFLGTPHYGADLAKLASMLCQLIPPPKAPNINIIETLKPESEVLADIQTGFPTILRKRTESGGNCIKIVCFYEELPGPTGKLIVEMHSAILGGYESIGIHEDHRNMTKFRDKSASGYQSVSKMLIRWVEELGNKLTDDQKECLRSLSYPEIDAREQVIDDPHKDSFHWVWNESTKFPNWLDSGSGFFWIQGKPGSGKSTLMKYILRSLESQSTRSLPVIASYFFNNRGSSLARSAEGLLRALLSQVLQQCPATSTHIVEEYRRRKQASKESKEVQWDLSTLLNMSLATFTRWSSSRGVILVIDALDECEGPPEGCLSLLRRVLHGCHGCSLDIKICISSRPEPVFASTFKNTQKLCLEDYTCQDIANYVSNSIEALDLLEGDSETVGKIKTEILTRANGVFLWVLFAVDELRRGLDDGDNVVELRERLSSIPSDLFGIYERILNRIKQSHREQALVMLRVVLCAVRPLTLTEFHYAITFGTEPAFPSLKAMQESEGYVQDDFVIEKRIRSRCHGLLEVTSSQTGEGQRIIQFMHQSVKDFLVANRGFELLDPGSETTQIARGHDYLSRSCIHYLTVSELQSIPGPIVNYSAADRYSSEHEEALRDVFQMFTFLRYSVKHCMKHCQKADEYGLSQSRLFKKFVELFNKNFQVWIHMYNLQSDQYPEVIHDTTPLAVAASFNIKSFVLDKLASVGLDMEDCNIALHSAASARHLDIVRLLVEQGADVNAQGGFYGTALQAASFKGDMNVVQLLLEQGADVNAQGGHFGIALQAASLNGDMNIVQLLLEQGADVNAQGGEYGTALQAASYTGHMNIVQLLLEKGADINAQGGAFGTALQAASFNGDMNVVQLLLEQGADVNAQGGCYGSALQAASYTGHMNIVQLLLEQGADVNVQGGCYGSALQAALKGWNRTEIAQLLLDRGAKEAPLSEKKSLFGPNL